MKFKPGKYYEHTTGTMIKTLVEVETTMWGKTLVAERSSSIAHELIPVGSDSEDYAQNWHESTEEEWMKNFS